MKHALSLSRLLLTLAATLALAGCDVRGEASPYKVIDTGYWPAQVNSLAEPSWLDNERIIFASTESLAPGKGPYSVKVLNTATGKLSSTPLNSFICARNGQIFYGVRDKATDKVTYYRGPLENAKEHPAPGPDMRMDERYDCDWVPKRQAFDHVPYRSKLLGENYIEILEERTKLLEYEKRPRDRRQEKETGNLGSKGRVVYHQNTNDPGRAMPPYSWDGITYSEFLDAYVVGRNYYDPKEPETRAFWILQRNGDIKEIPYPKTMYEGRLELYPIKLGYLMEYHTDPIPGADPFNNALYLMRGEQMQRLIAGHIEGIHISPDGCKAAFAYARTIEESFAPKFNTSIKLINFCQGGTTP